MSNPSYDVTALGGGSVTVPINQVFDLNITINSGPPGTGYGFGWSYPSFFGDDYKIIFYQLDNTPQNSNNYSLATTQNPTTFVQVTTIQNISYSTLGSFVVTIYQYQGNDLTQIPPYNTCTANGPIGFSFTINVTGPTPLPCFKEGSKILTDLGYKPIEQLKKGDLVQTLKHGFLPIELMGKSEMVHLASQERLKDQLYLYKKNEETIFEDLVLTGCHSILVDRLSLEQGTKTMEEHGRIYETDGKPRLMAYLDNKAIVYPVPGSYTIYHLALENEHYTGNYGIYANGLLVESCSLRYLKELSNMLLI